MSGSRPDVTLRSLDDLQHAAALAAVAPLQEVHLDLSDNGIGEAGAQALASSPHLQHLTHLDLRNNVIGDAGAQALAASPNLRHLTHLDYKVMTRADWMPCLVQERI